MSFNRIDKPLVFILGAGAHIPFGFPSGAGLREHMLLPAFGAQRLTASIEQMKGETPIGSLLDLQDRAIGGNITEQQDAFREAFLWSLLPSIDDFLRRRNKDFGPWGRRLLLHLMLLYERGAQRQFERSGFDWFGTLWSHINCPAAELPNQKVSFITFNYDRTIEHLLCRAAANADGLTVSKAWEYASRVPVIHLHGMIGKYLPQGSSRTKDGFEYGFKRELKEAFLDPLDTSIKLYWEADRTTPDWQNAKQLVRNAHEIYVLGIGSATEPLADLFGPHLTGEVRPTQRLTAKNLRPAEIDRLTSATKFYFGGANVIKPDPSDTAQDLLRSWFSPEVFEVRK